MSGNRKVSGNFFFLKKESVAVTSMNWSCRAERPLTVWNGPAETQRCFMLLGVGRLAQREKLPVSSLKALPSFLLIYYLNKDSCSKIDIRDFINHCTTRNIF